MKGMPLTQHLLKQIKKPLYNILYFLKCFLFKNKNKKLHSIHLLNITYVKN